MGGGRERWVGREREREVLGRENWGIYKGKEGDIVEMVCV
jgi:hypothetical protein